MMMASKHDLRLNPIIYTGEKEILVLSKRPTPHASDFTKEQRKKLGWVCVGPLEICGWNKE